MTDRPNILVFMTDDHGPWAARCCGNSELHTPTMDWIAQSGVRLTRAFTPCPVSSPARACFFTGRIPSQHGVHDYLHEWDEKYRDHPGIDGQTNLGQRLRQAGYQTALVGKWHCGRSWLVPPGFDRWFSYAGTQFHHFGKIGFSDQGKIVDFHGYQSEEFTHQAVNFLRRRGDGNSADRDKPFFLFVGYVDTHTPYSRHPERLVSKYRNATFRDIPDETPAACHGSARMIWDTDPARGRENLAQYYAAVSFIDEQVGRVIDELQAQGQLDNTLIIYTSDHGHMNGHHGLNSKGNATVPQNFIDESIMVPSFMRWPEHLEGGRTIDQPVDHCDLFKTILDAADVDLSQNDLSTDVLPGESYLPLLRGEAQEWRDAYFGEYGNARCIRTERFKLIRRYPGPNGHFADEFYDLAADPRERVNVIGEPCYADAIEHWGRRLDEYFQRYENPDVSGLRIADLPAPNGATPWTWPPDKKHAHG